MTERSKQLKGYREPGDGATRSLETAEITERSKQLKGYREPGDGATRSLETAEIHS